MGVLLVISDQIPEFSPFFQLRNHQKFSFRVWETQNLAMVNIAPIKMLIWGWFMKLAPPDPGPDLFISSLYTNIANWKITRHQRPFFPHGFSLLPQQRPGGPDPHPGPRCVLRRAGLHLAALCGLARQQRTLARASGWGTHGDPRCAWGWTDGVGRLDLKWSENGVYGMSPKSTGDF